MISKALIEETAFRLMATAAIEIPDDYLAGIEAMVATEEGDLSAFVLDSMIENWDAAGVTARGIAAAPYRRQVAE